MTGYFKNKSTSNFEAAPLLAGFHLYELDKTQASKLRLNKQQMKLWVAGYVQCWQRWTAAGLNNIARVNSHQLDVLGRVY